MYPTAERWAAPVALTLLLVLTASELLRGGLGRFRTYAAQEEAFTADMALVAGQPGPALCETFLVCFYAGKPFAFDPILVSQMVQTGRLPEQEVTSVLNAGYFTTIQLTALPERFSLASRGQQERFTAAWLEAISRQYRVVRTSDDGVILTAASG